MKKIKKYIYLSIFLILSSCVFVFFNEKHVLAVQNNKTSSIENMIEEKCNTNLKKDSKEKIILELRDFVFRTTRRGQEDPSLNCEKKFLLAYSHPPLLQSCGGYASEFIYLAHKANIEARFINLAVRGYFTKKRSMDTHVLAEVKLNNKWVVMDPTFNCHYACTNGQENLSLEEMNACVRSGYELAPQEGKTKVNGYSVGEYYIKIKDLMFAYRIIGLNNNLDEYLIHDWTFFK